MKRGAAAIGTYSTATPADGQGRLLDFLQPSTFATALEGVDGVVVMRPPPISDTKRYLRPFIDSMVSANVEHVVFVSLMGESRVMPHWRIGQDLLESGLGWTIAALALESPCQYREELLININAKLGLAEKVNDQMPRLLQRPSRALQSYIDDHRHLFIRSRCSCGARQASVVGRC